MLQPRDSESASYGWKSNYTDQCLKRIESVTTENVKAKMTQKPSQNSHTVTVGKIIILPK